MSIVLTAILALVVFGVMILVHELGHYLVARACHVSVKEFSVGMGPKLFSVRGKPPKWLRETSPDVIGTQYSVRLFPVGGYVSMEGEDEASDAVGSFQQCAVWKRMLITVAGALMNLLLGFLATVVLVGLLNNYLNTTVAGFYEASALSEVLQVGDEITSVNGKRMNNFTEIASEILYNGYKPIDITVLRNNETITFRDVAVHTENVDGTLSRGIVDFYTYNESPGLWNTLKNGFFSTVALVRMLWESIIDLLRGRFGMDAVSGPVGVVQAIGEQAQLGFTNFLYLFAFISINLGVFNLLPIPALDGGRLVFLLIEAIRRKPLNPKTEAKINGMAVIILFGFMILITVKDVISLFI